MARFGSEILIKWDNRPVLIWAGKKKGLFHAWNLRDACAIIELENGDVEHLTVDQFKFLDSQSLFAEYVWQSEYLNEST